MMQKMTRELSFEVNRDKQLVRGTRFTSRLSIEKLIMSGTSIHGSDYWKRLGRDLTGLDINNGVNASAHYNLIPIFFNKLSIKYCQFIKIVNNQF